MKQLSSDTGQAMNSIVVNSQSDPLMVQLVMAHSIILNLQKLTLLTLLVLLSSFPVVQSKPKVCSYHVSEVIILLYSLNPRFFTE